MNVPTCFCMLFAHKFSLVWFVNNLCPGLLVKKFVTAGLTCPLKHGGSIKSESSPTSEAITRRSGCINNLAGQSAACLHADYHIKRITGSSTAGPIQFQTISCNIYKDKQTMPTLTEADRRHCIEAH